MDKKRKLFRQMRKITANVMLAFFLLSLLLPGLGAFAAESKTAFIMPEEEMLEIIVKYNENVDMYELKSTIEEQMADIDSLSIPNLDQAFDESVNEPVDKSANETSEPINETNEANVANESEPNNEPTNESANENDETTNEPNDNSVQQDNDISEEENLSADDLSGADSNESVDQFTNEQVNESGGELAPQNSNVSETQVAGPDISFRDLVLKLSNFSLSPTADADTLSESDFNQPADSESAAGESTGNTVLQDSNALEEQAAAPNSLLQPGLAEPAKEPVTSMARKRFQRSVDILSEVIEQDGVELEAVDKDGLLLISFEDAETMEQSLEMLAEDPNVAYAEPNHVVVAFAANLVDQQWGPQKIEASYAWNRVPDDSNTIVTVAVIDTGVDAIHPDLRGVVAGGRNYIAANSSGKAYSSTDPSDDNGHGTHVSGIIAAIYNNAVGIDGVCGPANVQIIPLKVLNDQGRGTMLNVATAIKEAADMGADILNLSLGSSSSSQTEKDAIDYAQNKGCLIVAAAGNESTNVSYSYPASYPGVIAVGATDRDNVRAYFSNYGDRLDVVAPGVDILSTVPKDIALADRNYGYEVYGDENSGYYEMFSGTSMAAPHVAGLAALYKTIYPDASRIDLRDKTINTATDLSTPGKDIYYGNGLVNAESMLEGSAISRYVAFSQPQSNSEVYGETTIKFEINTSKGIENVDLYIDNVNDPASLLESISCSPGSSIYTYKWDTKEVADGTHVIYAVAKGESVPEEAFDTVSVQIANALENGFVLVVRDPVDSAAVSGAAVTLWGISQSGGYSRITSTSSDENGNVRLRDTTGGRSAYLVTASGSYKAADGKTSYFYFRKNYDVTELGATGDLGRSEQTRELNFTLTGEYGPLSTPVLAVAPEIGGQVRTVLNPWQPSEGVRYFMDDGNYDFYCYWSPSVAGAQATEATYFLTKPGVSISDLSSTSVAFSYADGAKITADYHHEQASGVFFLEGVKSDTSFGIPFVDNSVSSLTVYVSPGEYNTYAIIEVPSNEGTWQYRFKKEDSFTVTQGTATQILDFGGHIVINRFEPSRQVMGSEEDGYYLYRGDNFTTENSITDAYGNEISYVYGQAAALADENSLLFISRPGENDEPELFKMSRDAAFSPVEAAYAVTIWPVFTVNKLSEGVVGDQVHSERSLFQYSSSHWTGKDSNNVLLAPGFFRATLSYDGGPLGGTVQKTVDFQIQELSGGRTDVTMIKDKSEYDKGASYRVVAPYGTVDLYTWDGSGAADSWTKVNDRPYQANSDGVLYIPVDIASRLGSVNVALAQHTYLKTGYGNATSYYGYTVMPFKSLSELKFIDFKDTVPVSARVYDNYGNRKSVPLTIGVMSDGGGALSRPQFLGEAHVITGTTDGTWGNSNVYMDPGQCAYMYTGFTANYASLYLQAPEMNIMSGLIVELDGRKTVRMNVETSGDLKDGSVLLPYGSGAEKSLFSGHDLRYFNESIYWLPGTYSPIATLDNGTYTLQMESAGAPLSIESDTALRFGLPQDIKLKVVSSSPIANRAVSVDVSITDAYGNQLVGGSSQVQAIVSLSDGQTEQLLTQQESDNPFRLIRFTPEKDGQYTLKYDLDINGEKISQTLGLHVGENVLQNLTPLEGGSLNYEIISANEVLFTVPAAVEGFRNIDVSVQHPADLDAAPSVKFTHYRGERLQAFIRLTGDFSANSYPRAGFNLSPGDTVKVELILP